MIWHLGAIRHTRDIDALGVNAPLAFQVTDQIAKKHQVRLRLCGNPKVPGLRSTKRFGMHGDETGFIRFDRHLAHLLLLGSVGVETVQIDHQRQGLAQLVLWWNVQVVLAGLPGGCDLFDIVAGGIIS
jgi:hypothetical protein